MTDQELQNVVGGKYVLTTKRINVIEVALSKKSLDVQDREVLNLYLNSMVQRNSIRSMKQEILQRLGYESKNSYGSTVSRDELEAIYNFIIQVLGDSK